MDIESLRDYCLGKVQSQEGFPFGENTLVFTVKGKMFLLVSLDRLVLQFNVKCDSEKAVELREQYASILPGYHMNKKMWNTVVVDGSIPLKLIKEMIDDSYGLVVRSLPRKEQQGLL